MIIKSADDKNSCITTLQELLAHSDATGDVKRRIEQEVRNIQAGVKGEQESAYEIDFHYGTSKNWMIIHDLRIECDGRVAQIDHLIINRFMDIWVCESKHFSEGIAINEQGECAAFYGNKPYGVPSPIEQNKKHIAVLESVFKTKMINLPTRLGFSITPAINSLVLVSKGARISRPKTTIDGLGSIIKNDQFKTRIDKAIDGENNPLMVAKIIGCETLEDFARRLAAIHKPIEFNWYAKFGLPKGASTPRHISSSNPIENENKIAEINSKVISARQPEKTFVPKVGAPCPECRRQKLVRKSINRSDGTETDFLACQDYPDSCKTIFPLMAVMRQVEPAYEAKEAAVSKLIVEGAPCPRCGTGKLIRKPGKNGRSDYFACSNFAKTKCRFMESIS